MNFGTETAPFETLESFAWWRGKEGSVVETPLPERAVFSISRNVSSESIRCGHLRIPWIETSARTVNPYGSEEESLFRGAGTLLASGTSLRGQIPVIDNSVRPPDPSWTEKELRWQPWGASSTVQSPDREGIVEEFKRLFDGAAELRFEDGVETEFSKDLIRLVGIHGPKGLIALSHLTVDEPRHAEVSSEALRWLGRMSDPRTHSARLWLLERSLNSPSAIVRDGAILGLASLGDRRAIHYLQIAVERESNGELRNDIEQVLNQLKSAR